LRKGIPRNERPSEQAFLHITYSKDHKYHAAVSKVLEKRGITRDPKKVKASRLANEARWKNAKKSSKKVRTQKPAPDDTAPLRESFRPKKNLKKLIS
jgi:hypothetical protein